MLNREALSETFDQQNFPTFLCPTCSVGTLACDTNSIVEVEPEYSRLAQQDDSWEPDWITKRFSAHLVCNRAKCGEVSLMIGDLPMVEYLDSEFGWGLQEVYAPKAIFPTPLLFPMPNDTPRDVKEVLRESFSTYWQDKNSSMNKVRIAIELILDDRGIPQKKKTKSGKKVDMKLHERIEDFEKKLPEPAKSLMAAKMVGNIGSHNDQEIGKDIVLDVYDLLLSCINSLYGGLNQDLKKSRDMLIQSKGVKNR
ncbi:MAG: DUF4145 domain-containing protein [Deltaproteobacteria bacterium]|nr:DUF4145 domain-containing protein [Deltaproteobacteria bacterium]